MTPELHQLTTSWKAFDLALRENNGFDEDAYETLKQALRSCARAWAGSDQIPRLGANVHVEIVPATESNSSLYPEPVKTQITDATYEMQELVINCVAVDEGDIPT